MAVTPDPYALTDLATAKDHLDIPVATTDFDDRVQRFVNSATHSIEKWLDRKILKRSYTEHQDGRNNNRLVLKQFPADKPSELWQDWESLFTNTELKFGVDEFQIEENGIVVLTQRLFGKGTRNIKVVYEAGYTTVPPDIENACLWVVEWYYDMRSDRSIRTSKKGKNNETIDYLQEWPEWLVNQLSPYKRAEWPTANAPIENR